MIATLKQIARPFVHAAEARLTPPRYYYKDGKALPALVHPYNKTWQCERQVEVPEALALIRGYRGVLEVGNTLGHYVRHHHAVIDKYEVADGVLNVDIMRWHRPRGYDAVVAVSTLEHIGFDEEDYARQHGLDATPHYYSPEAIIHHLKTLLYPGGRLVVTTSLGYNPAWDDAIMGDMLGMDNTYYRRLSDGWHTCRRDELTITPMGNKWRPGWATALWIGVYDKEVA